MPRLIPDGPDIPGELIEKQEAGEMVFFCGAGISVPTGLPSFRRLVDQLYASLNVSCTPDEKSLIKEGRFDRVLRLLEVRVVRDAMRSEVVRLLSSRPKPSSLRLHRALLEVLRNPSGTHLVTTNYDDNFARAHGPDGLQFHAGPVLPGLDDWNSVVHLHGRIQASAGGRVVPPLVLTSADLGSAYIDKGWAARFVTGLMDRYTVVFVGYSMGDVVFSYLMEAITSRHVDNPTYSLVGYRDDNQREQRESRWSGTGTRPILYHSRNQHELLLGTVEEWAKLAADPHQYRVQVALGGLTRAPDKNTHAADPGRVLWALSDRAAIWPAFNRVRSNPVPGAYAAAWLHEFALGGLMAGTVQPQRHERGQAGPLVTAFAEQQLLQSDRVAEAVAYWIEFHAHSPEVFQWVINRGRNIGFELRRRLWDRLVPNEDDLPDIPPRLAHLWALVLAEPPEDAQFLLRLERILNNLASDHSEATDDILLRLLRPRLGVFPGPPPYRILSTDASTPEQLALLSCGHTDVILGCRDEGRQFNVLAEIEPRKFGPFLRRHAVALTEYLKTAFLLLRRSDRYDARYIHFQLSEAFADYDPGTGASTGATIGGKWTSDERRRSLREVVGTWTVLLDWVRESYLALPSEGSERDDLLRYWVASSEKMLWRLALESIEQDRSADFGLVGSVLRRNAQEVLWDPDCRREVLSVLRQVGTRASSEMQVELLDAMQVRAGTDPPNADPDGTILAEIGPRLAALNEGGVVLGPAAARTLATFERRLDADRRHEPEPASAALGGRIPEIVAALRSESVDVAGFREFVQRRPVAAMRALQELGHGGSWPAELWKATLDVVQKDVPESKPRGQRGIRLARILLETPDGLVQDLQHEIARLLDEVAEHWPGTDDTEFWRLWLRGWEHRSQESGILSRVDALTHALNTTAGKYAGTAMKRIQEATRKTSGPITKEQMSILDRICGDDTGTAGIVMLAFWVDWLYSNATDWTTRNIVARMRWGRATSSDERYEQVRALWEVVAFRGSITALELVQVLGSDLWTAVRRHKELKHGEKLVRFFVHASMSPRKGLIDEPTCLETARIVIRDSPLHVGLALREVLDHSEQPAEQVWGGCVRPWLDRFWPRETTLNTGRSSSALVLVIMATGDAFPDAVDWAKGYLTALDDRQIGKVWRQEDIWKAHPRAAVALLHRIVPETGIEPWSRVSLLDMLKTFRDMDPTIPRDSRFVELERRAAR